MGLILKNGIVFDPRNGIRGEKMDLFIKDGKGRHILKGRNKAFEGSQGEDTQTLGYSKIPGGYQ